MNLSELQHTINDLESALHHLGIWLFVATALVVLGLVLEYFHQIRESIEELKKKRSWGPICIIAGGLLITVGVAGELLVQGVASSKETALRKANHDEFTVLNNEAAQARKDAGNAIERASTADERASANEKEAARLGRVAEEERLERVRLEAAVAPRSLSLEQQKLIAEAMKKFNHHAVMVYSYGLDGEGAALAGQIIATLRSAGIAVADARASIVVSGGFETGVHVRGPDAERDFTLAIADALASIGKLAVSVNDPQPRSGAAMGGGGESFPANTPHIDISVGIKPLPILGNQKQHH